MATQTPTRSENDQMKDAVRRKYAQIASGTSESCCSPDAKDDLDVTMIGDEYDGVDGYLEDADLKLGCGIPTDVAGIETGDAVLDLGSGAGLDAFVARRITGETGRVDGVDFTPEMVKKARANADSLGYDNASFHEGDIEDLPLDADTYDVVISNCVLNLVPDKDAAFAEMHRVLRPGGHFCVSDVVTRGTLPDDVRRSAALYAGCIAGALPESDYLQRLRDAGFENVEVASEKTIDVPDDVLTEHADEDDVRAFRASGGALVSITVRGQKTAAA